MKKFISGFGTSGICPFDHLGYVYMSIWLRKQLMPSVDATVIINQVQQATPSDKSTEQNPVKTPATSQDSSTFPGACQNPKSVTS